MSALKAGFQQGFVEQSFDDFWNSAETFTLNNQAIHRLGDEAMLWHLATHMLSEPMRAIRIVDVVAFAEQRCSTIDWAYIRQVHPRILTLLSTLHHLSPLVGESARGEWG